MTTEAADDRERTGRDAAPHDAVLHRFAVTGPDGAQVTVATELDGGGTAPASVPRPYLHPVRTIGGTVVSAHHPADHDWHCGVGTAIPDVDGTNCWGGPTYVRGEDYVWRDDHGTVTLEGAEVVGDTRTEEVLWRGPDGRPVLHEERSTTCTGLGPDAWELRTTSTFRPTGSTPVRLGGPGSNGRTGAGYGGFWWRFPDCAEVDVRTATATGETEVHGSVASRVAWCATFGDRPATVLLEAVGHQDPWFVRVAEYPALGSALAWASAVTVDPDVPLVRAFRAVVADGRADPVDLLGR